MRIAQIAVSFPPDTEASGIICYHYALELSRLGHQVTVFAAGPARSNSSLPDGVEVKYLRPLFRFGVTPVLPQLLGIGRFDLVHLHFPYHLGGEMAFLNCWRRGQKYVVTYHNDAIPKGSGGTVVRAFRTTQRLVLSRAARILCPSLDHARNCAIAELVARREKEVVEMPNGVDIERFHPGVDGSWIRQKYGLQGFKVIIFVANLGRAYYYKGLEYLLQALAQLPDPALRLLIVGGGELVGQYQRLAYQLGIAGRTTFAGPVPHPQLPPYYAAADVLVLPSFAVESFGMPLVEAMACAKPVIATRIPGPRKVVEEGVLGLLAQPRDAGDLAQKIRLLMENGELRQRMGQEGRKRTEALYSWPQVGRRLEAVYREVVR